MSAPTDRRLRRLATVGGPLLLLASVAYAAQAGATQAEIASIVVVAGSFLVGGLVAWARRPANRTGRIMVAAGLFQLLAPVGGPPLLLAPVSLLAGAAVTVLLGYLILAFPSGELASATSRAFVVAQGVVLFAVRVANLVSSPTLATWGWDGANPYQLIRDEGVAAAIVAARTVILVAVVATLIALVMVRWSRASGPARRALTPAVVAGACASCVYLAASAASLAGLPHDLRLALLWSQDLVLALFPIGFLVGFLRVYMARSAIADLVVELGRTPTPARLRNALADALGDPTLAVAYWSPEAGTYLGADGAALELPSDGGARAVTRLERDGTPIAAITHDPALLDDPGLVASVASAMRLAVENERLQSEVERQLDEVRASRTRIVEAGDRERKRLERDLHDGAQQRLVSLTLALRVARTRLADDADPAVRQALEQASDDARQALVELRELARGIHPAVLTEAGLGAAVESLADRSAVPVSVEGAAAERLGATVEGTAYFVVSEALANVNKYSRATRAAVRIRHLDGRLEVEVEDDGVGGADPARGSGLRGLADRLSALDGTLDVDSPMGHGTRLVARIPVATPAANPG